MSANTVKVSHEGKDYRIDMTKALASGLCAEAPPPITKFRLGDVFEHANDPRRSRKMIIRVNYGTEDNALYMFAGTYGLHTYDTPRMTSKEVLVYLNENEMRLVTNVNEAILTLIGQGEVSSSAAELAAKPQAEASKTPVKPSKSWARGQKDDLSNPVRVVEEEEES